MAGELVSREKVRETFESFQKLNLGACDESLYLKTANQLCISIEAVREVIKPELAEVETEGGSAD